MKKVKIKKTKLGTEFRVRDAKKGTIHGEFDKFGMALKRKKKLKKK